ncbi:hypothetical protein [Actinophytocola sediminis]
MTEPRPFLALQDGTPAGARYPQTVHDLGVLRVPSGRLEACDPIIMLGEGVVVDVPPGAYPVRLTRVVEDDVAGAAYLSVVLRDDLAVARVRTVTSLADPAEPAWVVTDSTGIGFVDHEAVDRCMPPHQEREELILDGDPPHTPSWLDLLDDPDHVGADSADIRLPLATDEENVILARSWLGQGDHLVVTTHAADGVLLAVHLDASAHDLG